jgi:hypothetical protein
MSFLLILILFFLLCPVLPNLCSCKALLLRLIALNHTHTHLFLRTTLCEESVRRRDLYLYNPQYSQGTNTRTPAGFEPAIPASWRPQTYALERVATGIGGYYLTTLIQLFDIE